MKFSKVKNNELFKIKGLTDSLYVKTSYNSAVRIFPDGEDQPVLSIKKDCEVELD